jgi:putative acetyltransferase
MKGKISMSDEGSQLHNLIIRPEVADDATAVAAMVEQAFQGTKENRLIDSLRQNDAVALSLVAVVDDRVVGHILFSPVMVESDPECRTIVTLAPLAVHPDVQRCGVGSRLTREGLAQCREAGATAVVVIGHPEYYPRFGFTQAEQYGLSCSYIASNHPAFMVLELVPGGLDGKSGLVLFCPSFDDAVEE